jgi:ComF family protein
LAGKRERSRGYNQSEELARGIAAVTGLSVETGIVRRTQFEKSQTRLTFKERQANVEHAFALRRGRSAAGSHVLLVDDVVTSGSTLVSCGKELMRAGVARISVISVAFTK